MSLNKQFKKAVSSPFYRLSVEDLKPIALAFWHEGYTPKLSYLNSEELLKVQVKVQAVFYFKAIAHY